MTTQVFPETAAVQLPVSNNIARRSVSIFSRKGTDTPTPTTEVPTMSAGIMVFAVNAPPMSGPPPVPKAKSKRWTLSGRVEPKVSEGTILRAVPREAPTIPMTPLEREMATSPNDEILRAIGLVPDSMPASPTGPSSPLADITNVAPQRYYSKRAKKNEKDILGVWRDGQVKWGKENPARERPVSRPQSSDGSLRSGSKLDRSRLSKPKIQVIIPENHSARRPFNFMPFFQNGSVERLNMTAQQEVSPPSATPAFSRSFTQFSAASPPTVYRPVAQRPFQGITTTIDQSPAFDGGLVAQRPEHSRTVSVNSSGSDSEGDDNSSLLRSSRSSMTSLSVHNDDPSSRKESDSSKPASISSDASSTKDEEVSSTERILVETTIVQTSSPNPASQGPRMADLADLMRTPSTQRRTDGRKKRLSSSRGGKILAGINSNDQLNVHLKRSQTTSLDEAVRNLENSLLGFSYDNPADGADAPEVVEPVEAPIPEILVSPVGAPPALPRKSSKRSRLSYPPHGETAPPVPPKPVEVPAFKSPVEAPVPEQHVEAPIPQQPVEVPAIPAIDSGRSAALEAMRISQAQRRQQMQSFRNNRRESYGRLRRRSSVRSVLSLVREEEEFQHVESSAAEMVVFHILSKSETMDDIFNAALITRGFHHIFKRHELLLMRQTLHKQCAPHWEFRESCLYIEEDEDNSAAPAPEYTPTTYFRGYKSDVAIIASVKQLIQQQCSSVLRLDTITALEHGDSSRVDAALFRIWTFCQIFGSNKGREDDIIAQMDWLRGGILAHQESCSSTISAHDSFYISNVLLSAPEHFAQGNAGGLSAEDLYDMLEMWSCLTKLTSEIAGKTQLARQFGIFDETDVAGGDIDGEEAMLEEWQAYLLTLGLAPILDIIEILTTNDVHTAFAVAQYTGLTNWASPFAGSSRTAFLHEAVTRLYEERLCETFSPEQVQMKEMRSIRRARDSEFRQRASSVRSVQYPDRTSSLNRTWGSFRSVSESSSSNSNAIQVVSNSASPSAPSRHPPPPPPIRTAPVVSRKAVPHSSSAFRNSYFPNTEPIAEELPPYDPAAENERERMRQHPMLRAVVDPDPGQNSAEKAVARITEMGFTSDEAKGALKITDMGDGLRVDRAVEYLMRSKGFH